VSVTEADLDRSAARAAGLGRGERQMATRSRPRLGWIERLEADVRTVEKQKAVHDPQPSYASLDWAPDT
jgi:hypothetical protein